ncbi:hypothetical protein M3Y98_00162800 [Aphelenchoides besseyi]|nr:hypothetical protein M3Y98_00162800 [Aphelenchoides besseyi]
MLNIVCHITNPNGQTLRYTVKMPTSTTVQQLVDRIQSRFEYPPTTVQRSERDSSDSQKSHILFYEENIDDKNDVFYFNFERLPNEMSRKVDFNETSMDQSPQLLSVLSNQIPSGSSTPSNMQVTSTFANDSRIATPPDIVIGHSLNEVTIPNVVMGCRKAELIVAKLERGEPIEPGERQQLVRTAGRWLMEACAQKYKPTTLERAFFAKQFFGNLPNFNYEITDFHNSQSRGFLDVFIYNERDRKARSGEINRGDAPSDTLVKNNRKRRLDQHDQSRLFPAVLSVPNDTITHLSVLEENTELFETRFSELMSNEFNKNPDNIAEHWETCVAPKILAYLKRTNPDHYFRVVGKNESDDRNMISTWALHCIPFLVRRLHRETNTKLSYLIAHLETVDDANILKSMRENGDTGPVIFTDSTNYRIIVIDKIIPCGQTSALALEKLLKSFYVYQITLGQFRRAMITLILTLFGIAKNKTSSFKEVAQNVLATAI